MPDMTCPKCGANNCAVAGFPNHYVCGSSMQPGGIAQHDSCRIRELERTIADLRERGDGLAKFAGHSQLCNKFIDIDPCDCGYETSLARWREATAKETK